MDCPPEARAWGESCGQSASINSTIQAADPGIFVDLAERKYPAQRGGCRRIDDWVLCDACFVNPAEATGNTPSAGMAPLLDLPVSVTIGGVAVTSARFRVGRLGVLQINVTVVALLAAGYQAVVSAIGGVKSKTLCRM
jgi:hypothetical protein